MTNNAKNILISAFLVVIGVPLLFVSTDRPFILVPPQEGVPNSVTLDTDQVYQQSFTVNRRTMSRLGLFLRPATTAPIPNDAITITISRAGEQLASQDISAAFIDTEGAAQVRFTEPIPITPGQRITFAVSTSPALSGKIRAQLHAPDEQFEPSDTGLAINGDTQPRALAFQVYHGFRPPLAYQLGSLLILLGLLLALRHFAARSAIISLYLLGLTIIYLLPSLVLGQRPGALALAVLVAAAGMYLLTRHLKLPLAARMIAVHAFALTTWFPLHIHAGREKLIIFAALPLAYLALSHYQARRSQPQSKAILIALVAFAAVSLALMPWFPIDNPPTISANIRDIFLDPNQIPEADKISAAYSALQIPKGDPDIIEQYGGWDHFGSYLGIITITLAVIGIITHGRRHIPMLLLGAAGTLIAAVPPITSVLAAAVPLPPQYLIILTTFALAFFAAFGTKSLWNFLGTSKLTTFVLFALLFIALFDLLNVAGKTLQFGIL